MKIAKAGVLALAVLGVAAGAAWASGAPRAATHTVTIEGTGFTPPELTVKRGDVVVWVNKDPFPHTATSTKPGFDSQRIAPDKSWKYTATKRGDIDYICSLHPNMTGVIHVK